MSPSTGFRHELVSTLVRQALTAAGTPDFVMVGPMAVDLHPSYRIPDLIVVSARLIGTDPNPMPAGEVALAVDVASPGSVTTDRITKPAQYAAAGIASYWRVETSPEVNLTVYALSEHSQVYIEVATWHAGQTAHLDVPFPISVAIDDITPG